MYKGSSAGEDQRLSWVGEGGEVRADGVMEGWGRRVDAGFSLLCQGSLFWLFTECYE